jgi:hypothetical protein
VTLVTAPATCAGYFCIYVTDQPVRNIRLLEIIEGVAAPSGNGGLHYSAKNEHMNAIKEQLVRGWHPMRWLRLAIGLVALVQAISSGDPIFWLLTAFLFFQVYTNTGCGGPAGCALPEQKSPEKETKQA